MTTLTQSIGGIRKSYLCVVGGGAVLLVWAAFAIPGLYRNRTMQGQQQTVHLPETLESFSVSHTKARAVSAISSANFAKAQSIVAPNAPPIEAGASRKIIRTSSLEIIVAHPAETAEKITALAEKLGGYIETASSGGPNATTANLTVRVPADRFEEARSGIRNLGLRVESERVDAQDVTRQYVDQDASLRNLRAEEAQYLTILKQASTVKDMLAVSEQLSEVRGQIEQQEAEFHALSRQLETVSIAISLRTQAEAQAFGLNWRPLYQLKLALHDGLESVANYGTAMITVLFYLPATLLWVCTILLGLIGSWRIVRWIAVRWFGWNSADSAAQN